VYAVGRPRLTLRGRWLAAVLACGPGAVLSHGSAAACWGIRPVREGPIEVSVPHHVTRRPRGIAVHRRTVLTLDDTTLHQSIPLTAPICTLIDIASCLERSLVETAINEADKRRLTDPEQLRRSLHDGRRSGVKVLREILDRRTFTLTDSEIERQLLMTAYEVGLWKPETGVWVNGFKVDLFWRDLGLVVETDGLRYHRTPIQQARDRIRDQAHTAAGMTPLRFTGAQVAFELGQVRKVLGKVARRLMAERGLIRE
jgi:very-short-patch-repair endonuclease